jgi:hypothetical protein
MEWQNNGFGQKKYRHSMLENPHWGLASDHKVCENPLDYAVAVFSHSPYVVSINSTLVSPQHMNDITCIVVSNVHSNDQKLGEISVHGINMVLLRSAEFYELVNLRGNFYSAQAIYTSLLARRTKLLTRISNQNAPLRFFLLPLRPTSLCSPKIQSTRAYWLV